MRIYNKFQQVIDSKYCLILNTKIRWELKNIMISLVIKQIKLF